MKNTNEATQNAKNQILKVKILKNQIALNWDLINTAGNVPVGRGFTMKASYGLRPDKSALIVVLYSHEVACDLRLEGFTNIRVLVDEKNFNEKFKVRFEHEGGYSYEVMSNEAIADVKLVIGDSLFSREEGSALYPELFKSFGADTKVMLVRDDMATRAESMVEKNQYYFDGISGQRKDSE